jgi:thioredoxin-related protein
MRNFIILLLFITTSTASFAGDSKIQFYEGTWSESVAKAKESGQMVFLDCYTDWCYWCKVMDKETFTDTSVLNLIHSQFVPTRREMEKSEEGKALGMKYHVNGYPSYLIFDGNGTLVYQIVGYRKADEFKVELKKALEATTPLKPGLSAQLDPGFPEFYKKSFGTSKDRKKADPKEVTEFLDKQTDLLSEVSWAVMFRFTVTEKYENWIFENKKSLTEKYGSEEVHDKMVNIIMARVDRAAEKNDKVAYKAAAALVDVHVPEDASWLNLQLALTFFEKTKDWKGYADVVQHNIATNENFMISGINSCAWTIYEQCDDKEVIAQATVWMDTVCTTTEEYAYEDTYAALLYKKGDYQKAEEVALHAIDLGKTAGEDVSGTEALLANIRLKKK